MDAVENMLLYRIFNRLTKNNVQKIMEISTVESLLIYCKHF